MPVDAGGNATRPPSPIPVSGQNADAPQVNVPINDIYAILNMLMFLDGRKPLRGNIPMNGYRARGAADAEHPQDYVTLAQLEGIVGTPTGVMSAFSGMNVPAGWVRANGQTLERGVFPILWGFAQSSGNLAASEAVKTPGQYGPGNGSTTFTLPNLEADGGYFIRPVSAGRGIGSSQDEAFKSHTHTGTTAAAGAHTHALTIGSAGAHTHNVNTRSNPPDGSTGVGIETGTNPGTHPTTSAGEHTHTGTANSAGSHTHTLTVDSVGGTETRPKNIAYPVIIKA